jgi:teichuronic acid biosynthesis glycosyltransferase TuaG
LFVPRSFPLVSVVVPTYRDPHMLADTLASLVAQTETDWHALVIDDGSPEPVQTRIAGEIDALQDPRFQLILCRKNRGPARVRNLGARLATGRYLAFLDGDDLWLPGKLARQVAAMEASGARLSCTGYENVNPVTGKRSERIPRPVIAYDDLMAHNCIGCSTVMIDRRQVARIRFPDIRMRQDYACWLALLRDGHIALGITDILTERRLHPDSLSASKLRAVRYTWRMYRDIEGLSRARAAQYVVSHSWTGLRERLFG